MPDTDSTPTLQPVILAGGSGTRLWPALEAICAEMFADDLKDARRSALLKEHGLELPAAVENPHG